PGEPPSCRSFPTRRSSDLAILLKNNEAGLPPLDLQYSDFSVWQHQHFSQHALQHQLSYWQHTLAGAPAMLNLPTDKPRPAVLSRDRKSTRLNSSHVKISYA